MPSSTNTRFPAKVIVGASVAASLLTGLVMYINGDTYQAGTHEATTLSGSTVTANGGTTSIGDGVTLGTDDCIKIGSGEELCFAKVACVGSGGQVGVVGTTATAVWQNPLTSSASLLAVELDVNRNPAAAKFDIGTTSALSASGSNFFDSIFSRSGSVLRANVEGAQGTGATLVPVSHYVRALATKNFTSGGSCSLRIRYRKYGS